MSKRRASQKHPGNLELKDVPMFVSFGFDDNGKSGVVKPDDKGGVKWVADLFSSKNNRISETKCSATLYLASHFIDDSEEGNEPGQSLKKQWQRASEMGHEIGNHTHSHSFGGSFSKEDWLKEINRCNDILPEITGEKRVRGFRTPYLDFNKNTFNAVKEAGFEYDCSIEEGWQKDHDGTNFIWPYTLDEGSPGYTFSNNGDNLDPVPGLWEMPCYPVIIPPDELCEKYGAEPGIRASKVGIGPDDEPYNPEDGKITGLDYNMFVSFKMNKKEFLATMKYTFDLRLKGNRCPFLFGAHSDFYAPWFNLAPNITPKEMREAVEEFLDYVLSFDMVEVVSTDKVLDWIKKQ